MNIEVKGLESLIMKLDYLGGDSAKMIDRGLHKGALQIQKDALAKVPVGETKNLRKSVWGGLAKIPHGYAVGSNLKYAPYVEYGTGEKGDPSVPHTAKKFWRYKDRDGVWHTCRGVKARPFLHPAFNKNKTFVVKCVREELRAAIAKKLGRA